MDPVYQRIRKQARRLVFALPPPDFYTCFPGANAFSRHLFETHPLIAMLRCAVAARVGDNLGHDLDHAVKVTLDAGALMHIESAEQDPRTRARRVMLAQCAGLLHDIRRKEPDHAIQGAVYASRLLKNYPVSPRERREISQAIRNHEAFKTQVAIHSPRGRLLAACLYDADKFRWGPDNFSHTLWEMVRASKTPFPRFIRAYPRGMAMLARIKETFRTPTGQQYGPQFIEMGIAVGEQLLQIIRQRYPDQL